MFPEQRNWFAALLVIGLGHKSENEHENQSTQALDYTKRWKGFRMEH